MPWSVMAASMGHLDVSRSSHQDVYVRTTLTLDTDVARLLDEEVHRCRKTFKEVVNDAIRRGLMPGPRAKAKPYKIKPHKAVLMAGIDPTRLNQLADQLEDEAFLAKLTR